MTPSAHGAGKGGARADVGHWAGPRRGRLLLFFGFSAVSVLPWVPRSQGRELWADAEAVGVRSGRRSTGSGGARAGRLFGCGGGAAGSVCLTLLDAPGLSASPPRPFLTFPGSPTPRDPGPSPTLPTQGPRPSPTLPAPGSPALPGPLRALAAGGVRKNPSDPLRILCRVRGPL